MGSITQNKKLAPATRASGIAQTISDNRDEIIALGEKIRDPVLNHVLRLAVVNRASGEVQKDFDVHPPDVRFACAILSMAYALGIIAMSETGNVDLARLINATLHKGFDHGRKALEEPTRH